MPWRRKEPGSMSRGEQPTKCNLFLTLWCSSRNAPAELGNTMVADAVATQGARASVAMVLILPTSFDDLHRWEGNKPQNAISFQPFWS